VSFNNPRAFRSFNSASLAVANPALSALGLAFAGRAGIGAGQFVDWINTIHAKRASKTIVNVGEQMSKESIDNPNPELFEELIANALPYIGHASTEHKRQMMENNIMNGVRILADDIKQIEAKSALEYLDKMPDPAAWLFALCINQSDKMGILSMQQKVFGADYYNAIINHEMDKSIYWDGLSYLVNVYNTSGGANATFLIMAKYDHNSRCSEFSLSEKGMWLRDWIARNPVEKESIPEPDPPQDA
jgi:hypothetical protein